MIMKSKKLKGKLSIVLLLITVLFIENPTITKAEPVKAKGMTREIETLFQTFLNSQKDIYFKVVTMKGTDKPVLLISDSRMSNKAVTSCDVYIVKTVKKNSTNSYKLKKVGNITSNSTAYNIWKYENKLIYGSHHYTGFAEIKNDKLYINYYQGIFDKEGNETFYHLIYSGDKCISEKKISSSEGEKYIYDSWEHQTAKNILNFYKNTKANRAKYILKLS